MFLACYYQPMKIQYTGHFFLYFKYMTNLIKTACRKRKGILNILVLGRNVNK